MRCRGMSGNRGGIFGCKLWNLGVRTEVTQVKAGYYW